MLNAMRITLALVGLGLTLPASAVREIPVEDFFKRPKFSNFQLSPNGQYLAAIAPINNRRNIAVLDLENRTAKVVTGQTQRDVNGFMWANDDRILFFMDKDGNESTGIFAVNKDGTDPKVLLTPAETQISGGAAIVRTASVVNRLEDEDEYILVSTPRVILGKYAIPDVQKMNIYSGRMTPVERNPGYVIGWAADDDGFVFAKTTVEDGLWQAHYRSPEDEDWRVISEWRAGEHSFFPVWISEDYSKGYVSSTIDQDGNPRDKAAIYEWDPKTNAKGALVFEHENVDVTGAAGSDISDDLLFVVYNDDKPGYHFLNEEWGAVHAGVAANFPDKITSISSVSEDEQKMVFTIWSSDTPSKYYLLDRATNKLEPLGTAYDWIKEGELAPMQPITIAARDGLELPAYLTLPLDKEAKNLPLILHPHGGPRSRDTYGFSPFVQLLANRGYAVLQVNFRGSTGYGMEFDKAGWKEWGLKMQDDLTDSVKWAIEEGIADPDRICIFGGSYGGYATMAGLTYTPDLYQCGVNYVGVTSIPMLYKYRPTNWEYFFDADQQVQIGDLKEDREMLEDRSPVNHVDKIKAPLLMAYGRRDVRVDIKHATALEKELKKHEVEYELIVKPKEGHGFIKFENQVEFGNKLVEFFDKHIGSAGSRGGDK